MVSVRPSVHPSVGPKKILRSQLLQFLSDFHVIFRVLSSLPSGEHIYYVGVVIGALYQSYASLTLIP